MGGVNHWLLLPLLSHCLFEHASSLLQGLHQTSVLALAVRQRSGFRDEGSCDGVRYES